MPDAAVKVIAAFYAHYFPVKENLATAKMPCPICSTALENFKNLEYKEALVWMKDALKHMNVSLPTLYREYAEICRSM
jgi:Asp-tRNA(Asn)/Glu-tRNA(Gln) amidotransferase A subunit family amidase